LVPKSLALLAPFIVGALYYSGAMLDYSRTVDRPPAEVMRALADLDIREQPGTPGTDPAASGGVAPRFVTERGEGRISFVVMSGDQVATRMTAWLEPLDDGRRTRVTTDVARGDAPDARVSPAFRSSHITRALFISAVDDEIEEMLAPPRRSAEYCEALMARLGTENLALGFNPRPDGAGEAITNVGRMAIRIRQMELVMRRNGCPTSGNREFRPISSRMGSDVGHVVRPPAPRFEPGEPMIDVRRESGR
jgi:hypothetical protein